METRSRETGSTHLDLNSEPTTPARSGLGRRVSGYPRLGRYRPAGGRFFPALKTFRAQFFFLLTCVSFEKGASCSCATQPAKGGATQMPIESALFVAGVTAAFVIFMLALAWASRKSG